MTRRSLVIDAGEQITSPPPRRTLGGYHGVKIVILVAAFSALALWFPAVVTVSGAGDRSPLFNGHRWRSELITTTDGDKWVSGSYLTCRFSQDQRADCVGSLVAGEVKGTWSLSDSGSVSFDFTEQGVNGRFIPANSRFSCQVLTTELDCPFNGGWGDTVFKEITAKRPAATATPLAPTPTPAATATVGATPTPMSTPTSAATAAPTTSSQTCSRAGPPRVVVVLLMGLNSQLDSGGPYSYDPLDLGGCFPKGTFDGRVFATNDMVSQIRSVWDHGHFFTLDRPPIPLVTTLQDMGAVILPFSYTSPAQFTTYGSSPVFTVTPYSSQTPNAADLVTESWYLDSEVASIRKEWPSTHVVVIGHSEGGVVAEQWWRNFPKDATVSNAIAGIYSLDAPINGGDNPWLLSQYNQPALSCPIADFLPCSTLAQQFVALWYRALNGDDVNMAQMEKQPGRGIYTPIGTRGDVVMELLTSGAPGLTSGPLFENGGELTTQLFTDFASGTLLEPGRITDVNAGAASPFQGPLGLGVGLGSHSVVYTDPGNVNFLLQAVKDAATLSTVAGSFDDAPSPAITVALRLRRAVHAHLGSPAFDASSVGLIRGTSLGHRPGNLGLLRSNGRVVPLYVLSWSPTTVEFIVPSSPTEGLVMGATSESHPFAAGWLTVVPAGFNPRPRGTLFYGPVAEGAIARVKVYIGNGSGFGVPFTLSDGFSATTQRGNQHGSVTFTVPGVGTQHLVLYAQRLWARVIIKRRPVVAPVFRLQASSLTPTPGSFVTVHVHLEGGSTRSAQRIVFRAASPGGHWDKVTSTGRSGYASWRLKSATPGMMVVTADIAGSLDGRGLQLQWTRAAGASGLFGSLGALPVWARVLVVYAVIAAVVVAAVFGWLLSLMFRRGAAR